MHSETVLRKLGIKNAAKVLPEISSASIKLNVLNSMPVPVIEPPVITGPLSNVEDFD
jgi:hypothetical protein